MAPVLHAAQLQFSTGVEYSRGDYGETTPTEARVIPFSARVSLGDFSLRASIPYMQVRGPADIAPIIDSSGSNSSSNSGSGSSNSGSGSNNSGSGSSGSGSGGSGDSGGSGSGSGSSGSGGTNSFPADRQVQGLGDATIAATWSLHDLIGTKLYLDLTGRLRLSTGDATQGLGRGATDYAALAEIGWDGRHGGVFVLGGEQVLSAVGTTPRRNVLQLSSGYWRNIGPRSQFGMQGNWRQATVAGGIASESVEFFLSRSLGRGWRMEVSGSGGLSRASPDYSAGITFTWRSRGR